MAHLFHPSTGGQDQAWKCLKIQRRRGKASGPELFREQTMNCRCLNARLSGKRLNCSSFKFPGRRGTE